MEFVEETKPTRKQIGVRLLYTLLYLIIFELLKLVIQVTVMFQFFWLLITRQYSEPLRRFSNKASTYAYEVLRYMTLNDNYRPFPFNDFPPEMENPEEDVSFEPRLM
ncbi:MAG: DUF4389 domain-containing protein [Syntrophobacteraceae bacterium]